MAEDYGQSEIDKAVLRISRKLGGSIGIAEDLAQDLRILLLEGEKPEYLMRRGIDILRSRKYLYTSIYKIEYIDPNSIPINDDILNSLIISNYLESINPIDRAIARYSLQGFTHKEIGKIINKSRSLVSKRIKKLTNSLRS